MPTAAGAHLRPHKPPALDGSPRSAEAATAWTRATTSACRDPTSGRATDTRASPSRRGALRLVAGRHHDPDRLRAEDRAGPQPAHSPHAERQRDREGSGRHGAGPGGARRRRHARHVDDRQRQGHRRRAHRNGRADGAALGRDPARQDVSSSCSPLRRTSSAIRTRSSRVRSRRSRSAARRHRSRRRRSRGSIGWGAS